MAENNTLEKALKMHEIWNGKIETTAKAHVRSRRTWRSHIRPELRNLAK